MHVVQIHAVASVMSGENSALFSHLGCAEYTVVLVRIPPVALLL